MVSRPNETLFKGVVEEVEPAQDGFGFLVTVRVISNESPDRNSDFIRPAPGQRLNLFAPPSVEVPTHATLTIKATYSGGPNGGQNVIRGAESADY